MRRILFIIAIMLIIPSTSFSDDRWYFLGANSYGSEWFLDTRGIVQTQEQHILKAWIKIVYSDVERMEMVKKESSELRKEKLSKLIQGRICCEIDFKSKMLRAVEEAQYDNNGGTIWTARYPDMEWTNIAPETMTELIYAGVLQVFYGENH